MASGVGLSTTNSNYLSGSIKWTGLASGTDFGTIVDQLVKIERLQIDRLETWKTTWQAKIESIEGLNTRMDSLRLFCRDYDTYSEFYERTSSSTNTSVVTTTNSSSATPGTHSITVGENIPGIAASASFQTSAAVGAGGGDFNITVGSQTLTLREGFEWTSADTLDALASAINYYDNSAGWGGQDILGSVYTVLDKDRSGVEYKRLMISGKNGGAAYEISIDGGPSSALGLDRSTVDAAFNKTWLGTSSALAGGTYTGSTNKTFTFTPIKTGTIGTDPITIAWADTVGNSGTFDVTSVGSAYTVMQGVTVSFTSGLVIKNDSFTVDAFNPDLQNAQDKGLAQAEREVHQGFIDLLTPVTSTAAKFVYWYEGEKIEVDLAANAKLGDLVTAINGDLDNPGVTASIINDGMATTTSYHLVLTGKQTGAQHTIEIGSDTTLDNFDVVDGLGASLFSTSQKATDAMLKVDGYPSDAAGFIHRSTNTVADIVDGLVLELHDAGTATVTVSNNISAVKEKVQMLVDSVNFVLDYVAAETKYDADTGESGVMLGNYTYDMVRNAINGILYDSIPGLDGETDLYTHLSQLGIQTNPDLDGKWVLDTNKLNEALNKDPEAVARLFVLDDERGSEGVLERMRIKMEGLTDSDTGIGNVLIENYNDIINGIDEKIAREERRIALVRERLEGKFSRLEILLGQLDGQSKYIESQLDKLPTVGGNK